MSIRSQFRELNAEWPAIESALQIAPRSRLGRPRVDKGLKERKDIAHANLKSTQQQGDHLIRERDLISKRLESIQNTLNGRSENSLIAEISARLQSVRGMIRISSLKERFQKLIVGVIALVVLFVLQTELFLIIFLYLLIKFFKRLWRVHPVDALHRAHQVTLD